MATATITSWSQHVGGPKEVNGYFTADATTTEETIDLSAYAATGVTFAVAWAEDNINTTPIWIKETSFTTTSTTITVDHTSPTTTSCVIKFKATVY